MTDWRLKVDQLANCDHACPCQFNSLPTHGDCKATVGLLITEGFYGDIDLTGLKVVSIYQWPGAIHEGDGHPHHSILNGEYIIPGVEAVN